MKRAAIGVIAAVMVGCTKAPAPVAHPLPVAQYPAEWPAAEWPHSSPEAQGMSSDSLAAGIGYALEHKLNIHSLMVVRHGVVVLDAYFYPFPPGARHDAASVTKSITALLVGIAIGDGKLKGTNEPIVAVLNDTAGLKLDPRTQQVTIGDLLSMRSGFDCGFRHSEIELRTMMASANWVRTALAMPIVAAPGSRWGYCSSNFHLLSAAVTKSTGENELAFAKARLFGPLGITDVAWPANAAGDSYGWGDLQMTPRDMARIGLLMLAKGKWRDSTIVPASWVDSVATFRAFANENEDYGYGWWLSRRTAGQLEAIGRGGQRIVPVPSKDLVVVITGGGFEPGDVGRFVGAALRSDSALPPDSAGERRLAAAIAAASTAPPVAAVVPAPAVAREVSGHVYRIGVNSLGVRTLRIDFTDSAAAMIRLTFDGGTIVQPIGLDGRYRTAIDGGTGLLAAARGDWMADGNFALDLNLLARINRYRMNFYFSGSNVTIHLTEDTQLGQAVWHGRMEQ